MPAPRFTALRIFATLYAVLGLLTFLVGVGLGGYFFLSVRNFVPPLLTSDTNQLIVYGALSIVIGLVGGLGLVAFGQLIGLFLSIEESVRRSANVMAARRDR